MLTTFIFKDLAYKVSADYDYIIYDVGPSLGAINRNVLIGCDYFIIPMSSDIFSQKAIENIAESLTVWKQYLVRGLDDFRNNEGHPYCLNNIQVDFCIQFLGYVNQQYTAKKRRRCSTGESLRILLFENLIILLLQNYRYFIQN